jgi:glutamate racemase
LLEKKFTPDIIVVASNTPSLMLNLQTGKVVDVKPPLKLAQKKSKSKKIGILATKASVNSKGLVNYVTENNIPKSYEIFKIDGSNLVDLVESGKFLNNKKYCKKIIKKSLDEYIITEKIDTITLSSTHLLFLKKLLEIEYPKVEFVDPGSLVAKKIFHKIKNKQSKRNSLKIFTSGDIINFKNKLNKIGIKNKINYLST